MSAVRTVDEAGGIADGDALRLGFVQIDVIDPHALIADHPQVRHRIHDRTVDDRVSLDEKPFGRLEQRWIGRAIFMPAMDRAVDGLDHFPDPGSQFRIGHDLRWHGSLLGMSSSVSGVTGLLHHEVDQVGSVG